MDLMLSKEIDSINEFSIFEGLARATVEEALAGGYIWNCKHREIVYRVGEQAQSFCLVLEGAIKLIRHSPKGEDIIMHFAVRGDIVGALLMNQSPDAVFPISAKSMGATRVVRIPRSTFHSVWKENLHLQSRLNAILYHRMSKIQDDKTMSTSPLRVRIANLLLRHLDQEANIPSQQLSLVLTRQEIADSLGVAVESVIRSMREWQDDGTICRHLEKGPEYINIEKLLKSVNS